jgi:hypothetical protein
VKIEYNSMKNAAYVLFDISFKNVFQIHFKKLKIFIVAQKTARKIQSELSCFWRNTFQVLMNRKAPVMRKEEIRKDEMKRRGLERLNFGGETNVFLIELTKGSNGL